MEFSDYGETCTSEMAYDASQNYSAPCEKEEMELSDYEETCTSEMAYYASQISSKFTRLLINFETCPSEIANHASQNFIASYEKEEMEHFEVIETCSLKTEFYAYQEIIRGNIEINRRNKDLIEMIRRNKEIIRGNIEINRRNKDLIEMIRRNKGRCQSEIEYLKTCLSRMAYPRRLINEQQKYLNEYLQNKEEKTARNKYLIYLLMFGNIVWSGLLATSERGKISSVLGYLLGNDGAHSYNGNGLPLTTMRKRTCCNEDILVPARPATLPMNVLFRKPTNEEIARIAKKIGREFIPLACFLGFGEAELDQLENDYPYAVPRNTRFLLRWRDTKDTNPTVKKLADAFRELDFDPYIVYNSLETADKLPKEILLRELTDKEVARLLMKTTIMFVSLAILLGFTKAQLDEMRKVFNQVLKIFEMFKMEDAKTGIATIEKVIDVLGELGIIPDIIPDIISSSLG